MVMVAAGWISFLWQHAHVIGVRREMAERESAAYCQQPNHEPCEATKYAAMQARAEQDAVDASVWQIWLNVAGLLGLGATVIYARRAWLASQGALKLAHTEAEAVATRHAGEANNNRMIAVAAKMSSYAAIKSANVAEQAISTVERPYLFFSISSTVPYDEKFIDRGKDKTQPKMHYVWENYGRTPAITRRSRFNSAVATKIPVRPKYVEPPKVGESIVAASKSTSQEEWIHLEGIDASDYLALETGKRHLFWWGYVEYTDVFDRIHTTGFGVRYVPKDRCWTSAGGKAFNFRRTEPDPEA